MSSFEYISYKVIPLDKEQTLSKLYRFREIDKYRTFYKILPAVIHSSLEDRNIISDLLDESCKRLLQLFKGDKKPHKASLKKAINDCMKKVTIANVQPVNKDFAIELCWYLSDIAGLEMRKASYKTDWGYWDGTATAVKPPTAAVKKKRPEQ